MVSLVSVADLLNVIEVRIEKRLLQTWSRPLSNRHYQFSPFLLCFKDQTTIRLFEEEIEKSVGYKNNCPQQLSWAQNTSNKCLKRENKSKARSNMVWLWPWSSGFLQISLYFSCSSRKSLTATWYQESTERSKVLTQMIGFELFLLRKLSSFQQSQSGSGCNLQGFTPH